MCVSSISKDGCGYYYSKNKHNYLRTNSLGSYPECWRNANVTAIPKFAPSPDKENSCPILITPILSKVYDKLVSHKLSSFCDKFVFLPAAQFAYRKGKLEFISS